MAAEEKWENRIENEKWLRIEARAVFRFPPAWKSTMICVDGHLIMPRWQKRYRQL